MTTEPITTGEVLNVTRAVHDIAQTMSVTLGSKSTVQLGARRAQSYRAAADFLEAFGKAAAPDRSILFLAVTAEESGLLGSAYYAEHPL